MKFSIEASVCMSSLGKAKYKEDRYNPHKLVGKIEHVEKHATLPYRVMWSNSINNVYQEEDLILVDLVQTKTIEDYL